jgi:hypothetical protein
MIDSTFKPSMTKRFDVEINGGQYWAIHNSFDTFDEAEQEIMDCLNSSRRNTYSDEDEDYRISIKMYYSSESLKAIFNSPAYYSLYSVYGGHAKW